MGIPRIRGYRPYSSMYSFILVGATPHTRGSTLSRSISHVEDRGYPAYAGIDPGTYANIVLGNRLPRIRGDRPYGSDGLALTHMATPHTRGSTHRHHRQQPGTGGYPAYAGIDLATGTYAKIVERLPRIRGDRPPQIQFQTHIYPATPHTRGSTPLSRPSRAGWTGYPAYAGIDQGFPPRLSGWTGLPRIRGDRPLPDSPEIRFLMATPHTRGSTRSCVQVKKDSKGYPAYAGIDLRWCHSSSGARWLPRIRGDRPNLPAILMAGQLATPHTRGSTSGAARVPAIQTGYPAYAGIDRHTPSPPKP